MEFCGYRDSLGAQYRDSLGAQDRRALCAGDATAPSPPGAASGACPCTVSRGRSGRPSRTGTRGGRPNPSDSEKRTPARGTAGPNGQGKAAQPAVSQEKAGPALSLAPHRHPRSGRGRRRDATPPPRAPSGPRKNRNARSCGHAVAASLYGQSPEEARAGAGRLRRVAALQRRCRPSPTAAAAAVARIEPRALAQNRKGVRITASRRPVTPPARSGKRRPGRASGCLQLSVELGGQGMVARCFMY